jgi:4-hydroxy-tetrahydrodipicolinate reductase
MSVGINVMLRIAGEMAKMLGKDYDIEIMETHHRYKKDAPSGTAIMLAEGILEESRNKKGWSLLETGDTGKDAGQAKDQIPIEAIRAGTVAGVHEITYESDFDSLSIRHSAKDRRGFANGAVLAAEYIHDKKGFFTMKDVLDI